MHISLCISQISKLAKWSWPIIKKLRFAFVTVILTSTLLIAQPIPTDAGGCSVPAGHCTGESSTIFG